MERDQRSLSRVPRHPLSPLDSPRVLTSHQGPLLLSRPSIALGIGFLVLAGVLLTACGTGGSGDEQADGVPLYFEPIGAGNRASISDSTEIVLRSREEWYAYRDSLRPGVAFDSVDFTQAIVLLAALPQTTSGYGIEFVSVEVWDSLVVADYVVNAPSEDCLTAIAEVVPFQAILVRRTELPVQFRRSMDEYRCTFGPRR